MRTDDGDHATTTGGHELPTVNPVPATGFFDCGSTLHGNENFILCSGFVGDNGVAHKVEKKVENHIIALVNMAN